MEKIDAQSISTIAHTISDTGALIVIAAVFILLSAGMWVTIFMWFKNIINKIMEEQQKQMNGILEETQKQNVLLADLSDSLRPETQMRIKNIADLAFDLSTEKVCRLIKNIREENHISNKEVTKKKIRKRLRVIHENRNTAFESFTYRGRKLYEYCKEEWIEQVSQVVESEIYNEGGANNKRAYANVKTMYDSIKNDFLHQINY